MSDLSVQFYLRGREKRRKRLLDGDALPTNSTMLEGLPPSKGDPLASLRAVAILNREKLAQKYPDYAVLLDRFIEAPDEETALPLLDNFPGEYWLTGGLKNAIEWHLALLGNEESVDLVLKWNTAGTTTKGLFEQAFKIGLERMLKRNKLHALSWSEYDDFMNELVDEGLREIARQSEWLRDYRAAIADEGKLDADPDEVLRLLSEDRLEFGGHAKPSKQAGVMVVPELKTLPTGAGKERAAIRKTFEDIAGKPLELRKRGDIARHFSTLSDRWPHLAAQIETLLTDLSSQEPVWFRPTILVGGPGTGKSSLARAMGKQLGLPVTFFNAAGVSDGMFGGISSNWSTANSCVPLQSINEAKLANPLIVIDEIEKAGTGRNNGNLVDTLLAFLDRGNAAGYRDPALETEVDLSWVSYILTANSLEGIPEPLRDRCRVLKIPDPGWQHIGSLSRSILEDIADEKGVDPRWYPPLADDELEVVREAWTGGSIRQLRRAIEVLLEGREQHIFGRA